MFHQDPEETFHRSKQRPMNHHGLMLFPIFANVFQFKPSWQSEVKLHRGKLPQAANRIHQFHVDLRTVKRRFIRNHVRLDA